MNYYLGIDFGTSGARAVAIDKAQNIVTSQQYHFGNLASEQLPQTWQTPLYTLIAQIPQTIRKQIKMIAINGTSSTVLLCDASGNPITSPILYHDSRGQEVLDKIKAIAPENHVVISATSSLAKLLWWQQQSYFQQASYFLHQADWLAWLLHGQLGISDYHNALKLGYDVDNLVYPGWLQNLPFSHLYPQVFPPGTLVKEVTPEICHRFDLSPDCLVRTGTTDSIAAFLASGASLPGEAVTSLGSTLVLKLLSKTKINNSNYGIYSHRLGKLWLTGGASNTGGAVLKHFFNQEQLQHLSEQIDPTIPSNLNYYPLLTPGDRFPINNPNLVPQLEPRPTNPIKFLHGLLESIARIEALGYQKLQDLGAERLIRVYSAGGGARNLSWSKIRQRHLSVPVTIAANTDAAYGTALLAANSILLV
jgi:D-ribulokinase